MNRVLACRPATVGSTVIHCAVHRGSTRSAGTARPRSNLEGSGFPWTCGVGRRNSICYRRPANGTRCRLTGSNYGDTLPGPARTASTGRSSRPVDNRLLGTRAGGYVRRVPRFPAVAVDPGSLPRGEQSRDHSEALLTCGNDRGSASATCLGPVRSTSCEPGSQHVDKPVDITRPRHTAAVVTTSAGTYREG